MAFDATTTSVNTIKLAQNSQPLSPLAKFDAFIAETDPQGQLDQNKVETLREAIERLQNATDDLSEMEADFQITQAVESLYSGRPDSLDRQTAFYNSVFNGNDHLFSGNAFKQGGQGTESNAKKKKRDAEERWHRVHLELIESIANDVYKKLAEDYSPQEIMNMSDAKLRTLLEKDHADEIIRITNEYINQGMSPEAAHEKAMETLVQSMKDQAEAQMQTTQEISLGTSGGMARQTLEMMQNGTLSSFDPQKAMDDLEALIADENAHYAEMADTYYNFSQIAETRPYNLDLIADVRRHEISMDHQSALITLHVELRAFIDEHQAALTTMSGEGVLRLFAADEGLMEALNAAYTPEEQQQTFMTVAQAADISEAEATALYSRVKEIQGAASIADAEASVAAQVEQREAQEALALTLTPEENKRHVAENRGDIEGILQRLKATGGIFEAELRAELEELGLSKSAIDNMIPEIKRQYADLKIEEPANQAPGNPRPGVGVLASIEPTPLSGQAAAKFAAAADPQQPDQAAATAKPEPKPKPDPIRTAELSPNALPGSV